MALVGWSPCHRGMVRPQVANAGDGLQIWRVATNILNKQSRTADNGWSSGLGLSMGLTTPHRKRNKLVTKRHKGPLSWTDSLDKRPKLRKMKIRFGTWNVRTLHRAGSLMTATK
jgi:hypothetical protein